MGSWGIQYGTRQVLENDDKSKGSWGKQKWNKTKKHIKAVTDMWSYVISNKMAEYSL